jgi:hypothetical protein
MMTKSVLLPLAVDAAFVLFTEKISLWWLADRRHSKDFASKLYLQASGRFNEVASDGTEVELGKVTTWEAPHRIILDFYIATGPDHPTQAVITFTAEADGTRVTVVHTPKQESDNLWKDRAPRYAQSWQAVLDALATAGRTLH